MFATDTPCRILFSKWYKIHLNANILNTKVQQCQQNCDRNGNADVVELDLPKGQLAALLGTIPETLSRAFYKLSQEGIIEMNGTKIRLCNQSLKH